MASRTPSRVLFAFLLAAGFLLTVSARPQQSTLVRRETGDPEYVLGAGDQISIRVSDLEEVSDKPMRIDPDGDIDLPLAGVVHAAGLSPSALKQSLAAKLSKYIQSPRVTVNVVEYQSRPVSVFGSVTHAGVYQLQGPKRLAEVLSMAGGTAADAGPNVTVTRLAKWGPLHAPGLKTEVGPGSSSVSIPLEQITSAKGLEDNILIQPDDVIAVPRAELVYVVGNVRKAGAFSLSHHPSMSVLQAISLAEGFSPGASVGHTRILRRLPEGGDMPQDIPVDASRILAGKAPDVPLLPNDILFVPNSAWKASSKRALDVAIGITTGVLVYR